MSALERLSNSERNVALGEENKFYAYERIGREPTDEEAAQHYLDKAPPRIPGVPEARVHTFTVSSMIKKVHHREPQLIGVA